MMRVKPKSVPRAKVGDVYIYKNFSNKHTLTITHESDEPGYKGYYAYLARSENEGKVGHVILYGQDLFREPSIYEKIKSGD